jgi:dipeptidyl aminopeptidase/acylaminoacyl peptidase
MHSAAARCVHVNFTPITAAIWPITDFPIRLPAWNSLLNATPLSTWSRAGIYGHSGGGFATAAALFQYPEFFKVGVSSAGNHDNRGYTYYWGEKFQGLLEREPTGDNYENQAVQKMAGNLEGKLLISYGTMDTNVHPSMTLLVIDELIRQNKDFDLDCDAQPRPRLCQRTVPHPPHLGLFC